MSNDLQEKLDELGRELEVPGVAAGVHVDGQDIYAFHGVTRYVERMATIEQVSPLGATVSYNKASLSLAGRLLEKVTGATYEKAMRDLVLAPLGLNGTWFFPNDVMTRRFAVGHTRHEDGRVTVDRPWALPRSAHPAGGMSATAADQIAWARFHLGDGTAPDGTRVLSQEMLRRMQEPTADMRASALGDHVGIAWLLRVVAGERVVGHGGTTNGQHRRAPLATSGPEAELLAQPPCPLAPQMQPSFIRTHHDEGRPAG